jgi:hypothetical protein
MLTESMLEDAASKFGTAERCTPYLSPPTSVQTNRGTALTAAEQRSPVPLAASITDEADYREVVIDLVSAEAPVRFTPVVTATQVASEVGASRPPLPAPAPRPATVGHPPLVDDEYARMIGHQGEHFAFQVLSARLTGFDQTCWKSTSRFLANLPGGDDTLGYDFRFLDIDGRLSGQPGADCFIEVKSNARQARSRFSLSNNEWQLACDCHESSNRRFVIVRVAHIADAPTLVAIIVDPVRSLKGGHLALTPKDGWWVDHDPELHHPPALFEVGNKAAQPSGPQR